MTDDRNPTRLRDSPDVDPSLRQMLRRVAEDNLPNEALLSLADAVERRAAEQVADGSTPAGPPSVSGSNPLSTGALKLLGLLLLSGSLTYLLWPTSRPSEPGQTSRAATRDATAGPDAQPASLEQSAPALPPSGQAQVMAGDEHRAPVPATSPSDAPGEAPTRSAADGPAPTAPSVATAPLNTPESEPPEADRPHGETKRAPSPTAPQASPREAPRVPRAGSKREAKTSKAAIDATASGAPSVATDATEREAALLERAQAVLLKTPERALALLKTHRSRFPQGQFAQERDVLELEALRRLGNQAALQRGAAAFLKRYPHSPHRSRVQQLTE